MAKRTVAILHLIEVEVEGNETKDQIIAKAEEIAEHQENCGTYLPSDIRVLENGVSGMLMGYIFENGVSK